MPSRYCDAIQAIYRSEDAGRPISTPLFTYHGAPTGIYMRSFDGIGGAVSPREDLVVGVQVQGHNLGGDNPDGYPTPQSS